MYIDAGVDEEFFLNELNEDSLNELFSQKEFAFKRRFKKQYDSWKLDFESGNRQNLEDQTHSSISRNNTSSSSSQNSSLLSDLIGNIKYRKLYHSKQ